MYICKLYICWKSPIQNIYNHNSNVMSLKLLLYMNTYPHICTILVTVTSSCGCFIYYLLSIVSVFNIGLFCSCYPGNYTLKGSLCYLASRRLLTNSFVYSELNLNNPVMTMALKQAIQVPIGFVNLPAAELLNWLRVRDLRNSTRPVQWW